MPFVGSSFKTYVATDDITAAQIAADAVNTSELVDDAVTSAKIADNAITTALIADDAITSAKIADDAITSALIADDAVTTAKILNSNVTLAKMAANSVDSNQYVDASIDFAHIQNVAANSILGRDANSSGVLSEIALATTQILIGDGTGFTPAALSGDVTMTNAGVVTIANTAVETAMVNANVITGQTAETTIADDDVILIYDTSASAFRKMTRANFTTGLGASENDVIIMMEAIMYG
tara:strand:+ start:3748 stop:4461 length:714 start_codon:yes stop_codon:yes gene_type:complete